MRARRSSARGMSRVDPSKGSGGPGVTDKTSQRTALIVALIGATATVVAAVTAALISSSPGSTPYTPPPVVATPQPLEMPLPDCPTCFVGGKTFTQQAGMGNPKPTYRDPLAFRGRGASVQPGQRVEVVCRFNDRNAPPSVQPGWWYLIASPPWNRQYYTVANSYLNGDPPEGPYLTNVDNGVPVC